MLLCTVNIIAPTECVSSQIDSAIILIFSLLPFLHLETQFYTYSVFTTSFTTRLRSEFRLLVSLVSLTRNWGREGRSELKIFTFIWISQT